MTLDKCLHFSELLHGLPRTVTEPVAQGMSVQPMNLKGTDQYWICCGVRGLSDWHLLPWGLDALCLSTATRATFCPSCSAASVSLLFAVNWGVEAAHCAWNCIQKESCIPALLLPSCHGVLRAFSPSYLICLPESCPLSPLGPIFLLCLLIPLTSPGLRLLTRLAAPSPYRAVRTVCLLRVS